MRSLVGVYLAPPFDGSKSGLCSLQSWSLDSIEPLVLPPWSIFITKCRPDELNISFTLMPTNSLGLPGASCIVEFEVNVSSLPSNMVYQAWLSLAVILGRYSIVRADLNSPWLCFISSFGWSSWKLHKSWRTINKCSISSKGKIMYSFSRNKVALLPLGVVAVLKKAKQLFLFKSLFRRMFKSFKNIRQPFFVNIFDKLWRTPIPPGSLVGIMSSRFWGAIVLHPERKILSSRNALQFNKHSTCLTISLPVPTSLASEASPMFCICISFRLFLALLESQHKVTLFLVTGISTTRECAMVNLNTTHRMGTDEMRPPHFIDGFWIWQCALRRD